MPGLWKQSLKTDYPSDSSISLDSSTETDFDDDDCKHYNDDFCMDNESVKIVANEEHHEGSKVHKDIFLLANKLCKHLGLTIISTPLLGDCLPQSCLLSLCNRNDRLSEEEEEKLSITK